MTTNHVFHFRWQVKQLDERTVEMIVPRGNGPSILNPEFCRTQDLSDADVDRCEDEVIRAIAILD